MNATLRRVIGLSEHETPDGKLPSSKMVYLTPAQVGDDEGCRCGVCMFFNGTDCMLTKPSACDAEKGVCALFLGGKSIFQKEGTAQERITKEEAGYIEDAPTKCGNCEYWEGGDAKTGPCAKVGGTTIYRDGCCNGWEPK